jgi:hypothetical protein
MPMESKTNAVDWGRGMRLILAEEPTVQFKEVAQLFIASFSRLSYDRSKKTIDKTIDKPLSVTEKAIMELITANPSMTQRAQTAHVAKGT